MDSVSNAHILSLSFLSTKNILSSCLEPCSSIFLSSGWGDNSLIPCSFNFLDDGEEDQEGGDEGVSPIVSLLQSARKVGRSQNDGTWSRGRGKGGLNLRILRGRITKEVSKTEVNRNKKIAWKQWVKGYTAEINEIIKNNPKGLHIECEDCEKKVSKASYLRHRTVNGCSKMNPRIRFF